MYSQHVRYILIKLFCPTELLAEEKISIFVESFLIVYCQKYFVINRSDKWQTVSRVI